MPLWTTTISPDRKSTRLNSSHLGISYAVFCLKKNITDALFSPDSATALLALSETITHAAHPPPTPATCAPRAATALVERLLDLSFFFLKTGKPSRPSPSPPPPPLPP